MGRDQYVVLEHLIGGDRGLRFFTSVGPEDPTCSNTGEVWYKVVGYADSIPKAQALICETNTPEALRLRGRRDVSDILTSAISDPADFAALLFILNSASTCKAAVDRLRLRGQYDNVSVDQCLVSAQVHLGQAVADLERAVRMPK